MTDQALDGKVYDVLGIGFGPSNIALAVALEEESKGITSCFLEANEGPEWQSGMLLDGSDIQNNPLRDLVTPRNPRSKYTFTNYLKTHERLFKFLNLGMHYPLRKEYAAYVKWVASQFSNVVQYSAKVSNLHFDEERSLWCAQSGKKAFFGKTLVFAPGRSRNIPEIFKGTLGPRVFHLTEYLPRLKELGQGAKRVAVLGSSQSAVEIATDLGNRDGVEEVHLVHRAFGIGQKNTSPFTDEVYFPEFVDYFHPLSRESRISLTNQLRSTNYSSADIDETNKLYNKIYEDGLDGLERYFIHNNCFVSGVQDGANSIGLDLVEQHANAEKSIFVDAVVLATGFLDLGVGNKKEKLPPLLQGLEEAVELSDSGEVVVTRDYRLKMKHLNPIYLNGICEVSHGLGDAGSFSLLSVRSETIVRSIIRTLEMTELKGNRAEGSVAAE